MDMIKVLFSSKKFTAMIIGIIATFLSTRFNLPEEQVREIVALVIAYIIGQGVADMGKQTAKT
tara:strand:- start:1392 stop:1580 length:189 start_codon:yes stop_codon:yes gene_type:complete